jgi:hypothetical protein
MSSTFKTTSFRGPLILGATTQTTTNPPVSGKIRNVGIGVACQVSKQISYDSGSDFDTGMVLPQYSQILSFNLLIEQSWTNSSTSSMTIGGFTQSTAQGKPLFIPNGAGLSPALAISATEMGPLYFKQIAPDSWFSISGNTFNVGNGDSKIYVTVAANSATAGTALLYMSYIQSYWDLGPSITNASS